MDKYVIGIDYGTDSVRAIIVNGGNGKTIASAVSYYQRWKAGHYCDAVQNQFRQHPLDHIEGLESAVKNCLDQVGDQVRNNITGISVASTGSTPVAVDEQGTPLALLDSFSDNPNAMFILWKDHTAIPETEEINAAAKKFDTDYLKYIGGSYSSEWYWAKLLHILRHDEEVKSSLYTFVEHSDWVPFLLTGGTNADRLKRNVCAAGHKALWAEEFEGLPPKEFFSAIDPVLEKFVNRFGTAVSAADESAGNLSEEWADKLGLSTDVKVGIGIIDAHAGAVGGEIKPYYMSKVIGTSTCDMMVVPKADMKDKVIEGIAGQVHDSIIPGTVGLEAGQSAFGDIYAWFKDLLLWPLELVSKHETENVSSIADNLNETLLNTLNEQAAALPLEENAEIALDWFNGRRSPHVNPNLKGALENLTLGSTPPRIYRALVEATCFGSRAIAESIEDQGVEIRGVIAIGGIARKSEYVIQTLVDVLDRPIHILSTEKTVAQGAAMFASVISNLNPDVQKAIDTMGKGDEKVIQPRPKYVEYYNKRYDLYKRYGNFQETLSQNP